MIDWVDSQTDTVDSRLHRIFSEQGSRTLRVDDGLKPCPHACTGGRPIRALDSTDRRVLTVFTVLETVHLGSDFDRAIAP